MLIRAISKKYADGRMGTATYQKLVGKFKGKTITVESFGNVRDGIKQKSYTIDAPNFQQIINKARNKEGKFEVLG